MKNEKGLEAILLECVNSIYTSLLTTNMLVYMLEPDRTKADRQHRERLIVKAAQTAIDEFLSGNERKGWRYE